MKMNFKLALSLTSIFLLNACGGSDAEERPRTYTVSTQVSSGGVITPASQIVNAGESASFTVTADSDFDVDSVSGCGGTLNGATFAVNNVTQSCSISAVFEAKPETEQASKVSITVYDFFGGTEVTELDRTKGRTYRFAYDREPTARVHVGLHSDPELCELSITPEHVDYTPTGDYCAFIITASSPYDLNFSGLYGFDGGLVAEFSDFNQQNVQNAGTISHTLVLSEQPDITLENYQSEDNILASGDSPIYVDGLENNKIYYAAIVADVYGDGKVLSYERSAAPYIPAADLQFDIADAQVVIIFDQLYTAPLLTTINTSPPPGWPDDYYNDRSAKPTNMLMLDNEGVIRPAIESIDATNVADFVVTPDYQNSFISFYPYSHVPPYVGGPYRLYDVITRNECGMFNVSLAAGEHRCAVRSYSPALTATINYSNSGYWDQVGAVTVSPEMEDGRWVGSLYFLGSRFRLWACNEDTGTCSFGEDGVRSILRVGQLENSEIFPLRGANWGIHAVSKDTVLMKFSERDREGYKVVEADNLLNQEITGVLEDSAILIGGEGQFALSGALGGGMPFSAGATNDIASGPQKRALLVGTASEYKKILRSAEGQVYGLTEGFLHPILPFTDVTIPVAVGGENFSSWLIEHERDRAPFVLQNHFVYVETVSSDIEGGSSYSVVRAQNLASGDVIDLIDLPQTILGWRYQAESLWLVAQNLQVQTPELHQIDIAELLAGTPLNQVHDVYRFPESEANPLRVRQIEVLKQPNALEKALSMNASYDAVSGKTISIEFSVPMNQTEVENSISLVASADETEVSFVPFWVHNTLHLIPNTVDINQYVSGPLAPGGDYELRFSGVINAKDGRELSWQDTNLNAEQALLISIDD